MAKSSSPVLNIAMPTELTLAGKSDTTCTATERGSNEWSPRLQLREFCFYLRSHDGKTNNTDNE